MGLRMPAPFRHKKSGIFWLRIRVPADLVPIVGKKEEKFSLRTRDPATAKTNFIEEMNKLEARWRSLRLGTKTISHREAVAISGDFYRRLVAEGEENPGDRTIIVGGLISAQVAAGDRNVQVIPAGNPEVTRKLLEGIKNQNRRSLERYLEDGGEIVDGASFERTLVAVNKAVVQGREQVLRFEDHDYRPDPNADRFPERKPKSTTEAASGQEEHYLLKEIYKKYAAESEQAASTRKKWGAIMETVAKTHPDVRSITPDWCVQWKDLLVEQGLSLRTIQFGYLAALRSTLEWARNNRRIGANPMAEVGVKIKKTPQSQKKRGFKDDEAKFVLGLTLKPVTGRLTPHHRNARRWIPWVACYTGARVGEISQLRKEDVKVEDGIALLWITPEAGSVKDGNSRFVAVHSHLIEQGFMDFVASSQTGPLFYDPKLGRNGSDKNPQSKKVGERICAWIRNNGVNDKRLSPNHAWRHRFKTQCRSNKVDPGTRDYLQGHVPHNDAEGYGEFPPEVLRNEIEKLPRVEV